ncbi:MAG: autotransporter outer membrane beta-barrel domain-containing protein [Phascolarctobacterium sp.]|nr:autotransporter outer membrane beta-barrel domain-containing protein [Phascolarctobacterium sp.]
MSKKMLKRSLALGALMAFVITGQAWAETKLLSQNESVTSSIGSRSVYKDIDLNGYKLDVQVSSNWAIENPSGLNIIDGSDGKTGTLNIVNTKGTGLGALNGGTVNVGSLFVESSSNALSMVEGTKDNTVLNITANVVWLKHTGDDTNAIQVNKGTVNIGTVDNKVGTLTIDGNNIKGENNDYKGRAIRQTNGGKVNIYAKNLNIDGYNEAIKVDGSGILTLNADEGQIKSDIEVGSSSSSAGTVNMTLGSGVTLEGSITTKADSSSSKITLNGATWNVTGESNVSEISGTDANIKVKDAKAADGWVKVGNVTATNLTVSTETSDSNTDETLVALSKVAVDASDNTKSVAKQVQLKNAIYDNVVGNVTNNGVEIAEKQVASANVSVNDMAAIGLMGWRAEMNDMNKRMGELRNANGEHGVWVRMVRGESEYNSVKNQYNQYQLGYDEKLSVDKRWTVGVALSYTDAENNFAQGNGESTNKALSIYGSKLNDDGTFVDLIAKYARLENDFETFSGMGAADYDANGYSFSAEFGKRIQQGKGLWIEPQVELTYGRVGSVDYVSENGVRVAQDSMDSLVGRIGFSLGKDIEKGNVYARASYLYDFDGETKATLNNDAVLKNDLGGGWWEVGVGANINLSKATYIYADVEKTFGGEVDTNWQWNLGVRYSF